MTTAEIESPLERVRKADAEPVAVKVKPLEWVDADEGMCTKWRAAALGGHYELVDFGKDDPGFAVNFHWGRPLSFWFIQGEPDEWGPTGPKIFPTLEAAKAAAQADYEQRIRSALVSAAAPGLVERVCSIHGDRRGPSKRSGHKDGGRSRDPFHLRSVGSDTTFCGRNSGEWLLIDKMNASEAATKSDCCVRCAALASITETGGAKE